MTNPLKSGLPQKEIVIPPMGDSPEAKAERMRFWIDRGNAGLDALGKTNLEWRATDGNYWIAERGAA